MNNKGYDWGSFRKEVIIHASPERLISYWVIPEKIEKWFVTKADFIDPEGEIRAKNCLINTSDRYEWKFFDKEAIEEGVITEWHSPHMLQFTFSGESYITVYFFPQPAGTKVYLIQEKIPSHGDRGRIIHLEDSFKWDFYLQNLKCRVEAELDMRKWVPGGGALVSN